MIASAPETAPDQPAAEPLALRLNFQLGLATERGMLYRDRVFNRLAPPIQTKARLACADIAAEADAEIERLRAALQRIAHFTSATPGLSEAGLGRLLAEIEQAAIKAIWPNAEVTGRRDK